ncbi:MAG TPA: hypothetical protein VET23_08525 [Chitinophagaceae bacterium]|nr:hypothetical protein [Chitinophagaceae bacterium]
MLDKQIKRQHILDALADIAKNGVPSNRKATKYNLYHNGKSCPPKYVLSVAAEIATGKELEPSQFSGGKETNTFLSSLGFTIREGSKILDAHKSTVSQPINICTALIQIPSDNWDKRNDSEKIALLSSILNNLSKDTDILILPAGFLNSKNKQPATIFSETEKVFTKLIRKHNDKFFICFGIDGRHKADQLALVVDKTGIIAIARKFHPTNDNKRDNIPLADNPFTKENNKERDFIIKGKRACLAVCYDIFGISKLKLDNANNYDFIIGVIHGFGSSGGDSDFARKGLAGASKQWEVHSYASAVFSDNRNATNWTSGVEWKHRNASVNKFNYAKIRIDSKLKKLETDIATIYLRLYEE